MKRHIKLCCFFRLEEIYIYKIYNLYTIWTWLRGSELVKIKILPTSFGHDHFQGNLLKL